MINAVELRENSKLNALFSKDFLKRLHLSHQGAAALGPLRPVNEPLATLDKLLTLEIEQEVTPESSLVWTDVNTPMGIMPYIAYLIYQQNIDFMEKLAEHLAENTRIGELASVFLSQNAFAAPTTASLPTHDGKLTILHIAAQYATDPTFFQTLKPILTRALEQNPTLMLSAEEKSALHTAVECNNLFMADFLLFSLKERYHDLSPLLKKNAFEKLFTALHEPLLHDDSKLEMRRLLYKYGVLLISTDITEESIKLEHSALYPNLTLAGSPFINSAFFNAMVNADKHGSSSSSNDILVTDLHYWKAYLNELMRTHALKSPIKAKKFALLFQSLNGEDATSLLEKKKLNRDKQIETITTYLKETNSSLVTLDLADKNHAINKIRLAVEAIIPAVPDRTLWDDPRYLPKTNLMNAAVFAAYMTGYYYLAVFTAYQGAKNDRLNQQLKDEFPECMISDGYYENLDLSSNCLIIPQDFQCSCDKVHQPWCDDFLSLYEECNLAHVKLVLSAVFGLSIPGGIYLFVIVCALLTGSIGPFTQLGFWTLGLPGRLAQLLTGSYTSLTAIDNKDNIVAALTELIKFFTVLLNEEEKFAPMLATLSKPTAQISSIDLQQVIQSLTPLITQYHTTAEWIVDDLTISDNVNAIMQPNERNTPSGTGISAESNEKIANVNTDGGTKSPLLTKKFIEGNSVDLDIEAHLDNTPKKKVKSCVIV